MSVVPQMLNVLFIPTYLVGHNITSATVSINVTKSCNSHDRNKKQSVKRFPEELRTERIENNKQEEHKNDSKKSKINP